MTAAEYVAAYKPRIGALMHTAPVYDKLTEPKRVPVPAACMEMPSKGCKCFTQDATPYPTDDAFCRQVVRSGLFLAFAPEGVSQASTRPVAASAPVVASTPPAPAPAGPAVFPAPPPGQVVASTQAKARGAQ